MVFVEPIQNFCSFTGFYGLLQIRKQPEVNVPPVDSDLGDPFVKSFVPADALAPALISNPFALISRVLLITNAPQILYAVVGSIPVYMIYLTFRKDPVDEPPG